MSEIKTKINLDLTGFLAAIDKATKKANELALKLSQNIKTKVNVDASGIEKVTKESDKASKAVENLGKTSDKTSDIIVNANKKTINSLEKVNKELNDSEKKSSSFGDTFKGMFAGGVALGAIQAAGSAITSFITGTVDEFNKLDVATRSMSTLGKEAELLAPKLRELSIEMSQRLPFAASELQNSFTNAIASGVKGGEKELAKFVETAGKLATGGGTSIDSATAGLAATLNAFGKGAEDAEKFADTFFNTVNYGVVSVDELNQFLSQVTPTAAAAGLSFENVGAGIALLTQKGVPAAQATTKLNQMLIELQKPGAELKKIFAASGLSLQELQTTMQNEGLPATLDKVQKAFDAAGVSATQAFSSSEAGSAFNVLQAKAGEFQDTLNNVANTAGSTDNAFQKMSGSMENQMTLLKNQVNASLMPAIQALMPVVTELVKSFADELMPVFKDLMKESLPGLKMAMSLLIPIFVEGAKLTRDLVKSYTGLIEAANWLGNAITSLFKSMGVNINVGKLFSGMMDGIRFVIVTMINPIGAIKSAIETLLETFGLIDKKAPLASDGLKKIKTGMDATGDSADDLKNKLGGDIFGSMQLAITSAGNDKDALKRVAANIASLGNAGQLTADQVKQLNDQIKSLTKPPPGGEKTVKTIESVRAEMVKLSLAGKENSDQYAKLSREYSDFQIQAEKVKKAEEEITLQFGQTSDKVKIYEERLLALGDVTAANEVEHAQLTASYKAGVAELERLKIAQDALKGSSETTEQALEKVKKQMLEMVLLGKDMSEAGVSKAYEDFKNQAIELQEKLDKVTEAKKRVDKELEKDEPVKSLGNSYSDFAKKNIESVEAQKQQISIQGALKPTFESLKGSLEGAGFFADVASAGIDTLNTVAGKFNTEFFQGLGGALITGAKLTEQFMKIGIEALSMFATASLELLHGPIVALFTSIIPYVGAIVGEAAFQVLKGILSASISKIGGFKKGGYTGEGNPNDVAGVTHKKEYVMNEKLTREYRPLFEYMQKGGRPESYYRNINVATAHEHKFSPFRIKGADLYSVYERTKAIQLRGL